MADPLPQPPDAGGRDGGGARRRPRAAARARDRCSACGRGAGSLDAATRADLWARHEAALPAGPDEYRRLDTLLHLAIAEAAGIPSLVALVAENRADVNAWLDTFPLMPRNIQHSGEQHERIVSAILAGRPDAAEAAMRDHLAGSEALLRGFLV